MQPTLRVSCVLILVAVVVAGLASGGVPAESMSAPARESPPAEAPPEPADADCGLLRHGGVSVFQASDGTLSGCFRVGSVGPGRFDLHLEKYVSFGWKDESAPKRVPISLSPKKGPPGTIVQISGFLPEAASDDRQLEDNAVSVCWGGCADGFVQTEAMRWESDGHFTTSVQVPAVPWLTADGPYPLEPGPYPVVLPCIRTRTAAGSSDCWADGDATFRLDADRPTRCTQGRPCAELDLTPTSARPGEVVRVRGWAPLVDRGHVSFPRTYDLKLVPASERPGEGEATVSWRANGTVVALGWTPFTVRPGHPWAEIEWSEAPLIQPGGSGGLAPDPANPRLLATCVPGAVRVSRDGGATWTTIPVQSVREAARGAGLTVGHHPQPEEDDPHCSAAAADPAHPEAVFATFTAYAPGGPPPFYLFPAATSDGGRTWQRVPRPPAGGSSFGGFAVSGDAVQGRFFRHDTDGDCCLPGPPAVVQTTDGARTWQAGTEVCPARGPCVTWGPEATGNCAKGQPHQSLRRSTDGGRSWSSPKWPPPPSTCRRATLVNPSETEVLLLQEQSAQTTSGFPLLRSPDGGASWEAITLPPLPGTPPEEPRLTGFPHLTVLSNGHLLAFTPTGAALLPPGAHQWCRVAEGPFADDTPPGYWFQAIGERVWWKNHAGDLHSVDQDQVRCQ